MLCLHVQQDDGSCQSDCLPRQAGECHSSVALPYVSKEHNKLSNRKNPLTILHVRHGHNLSYWIEKDPSNPADLVTIPRFLQGYLFLLLRMELDACINPRAGIPQLYPNSCLLVSHGVEPVAFSGFYKAHKLHYKAVCFAACSPVA